MSQTGGGFKVISEKEAPSLDAEQNLIGCTYYETSEMSSKIPVPVNRKSNCPSKLALCQQGAKSPRSGSDTNGDEEEGKKLICMIKIRTKSGANVDIQNSNEKKTVSLNTADEKYDTRAPTEATKGSKTNKCTCKTVKTDPFVPLSEIEATYFEHYVEELQYSTTGVQTDIHTGSESIDSLPGLQEIGACENGTEIPWQKLILSSPNEYTIRSSKKEVIHIIFFAFHKSVCSFL